MDEMMTKPNQITGAKAGGLRQLPMRSPLTARITQFRRSRTQPA